MKAGSRTLGDLLLLKFTVINHYKGKNADDCYQEEGRYKRFLGGNVNYTAP